LFFYSLLTQSRPVPLSEAEAEAARLAAEAARRQQELGALGRKHACQAISDTNKLEICLIVIHFSPQRNTQTILVKYQIYYSTF
jgi:hypothetical protein